MRILSIDGGGIRGLIPAVVLADVERRTGQRVAELFDLIAGTSTGGILACSLARPDPSGRAMYTAEALIDLYVSEGPRIFDRSLLKRITSIEGIIDERYDSDGLEAALAEYLGDSTLSQALVPITVTAYDIEARNAFFFRSERARTDRTYDFTMADVAHATSAAPTYFEPAEVTDLAGARTYPLIDGGVFASNPSAVAYTDLLGSGPEPRLTVLASLGTGTATTPIEARKARGWGQLGWARPVIDVLLSSQTETVDFELARLLGTGYVRLQRRLEEAAEALDDASQANLKALRAEGDRIVRDEAATIDALCARLVGGA